MTRNHETKTTSFPYWHVYPPTLHRCPFPSILHPKPSPFYQGPVDLELLFHSRNLRSACRARRDRMVSLPLITDGFSLIFCARSDCFQGGSFSERALAIAFPTATSIFGGGATSFSLSILVSFCPSVLWAAFVLWPARNFSIILKMGNMHLGTSFLLGGFLF